MIGRLEDDGVVVSDEPIAFVVLLGTLVGVDAIGVTVGVTVGVTAGVKAGVTAGAAIGADVGDNVHTGPVPHRRNNLDRQNKKKNNYLMFHTGRILY